MGRDTSILKQSVLSNAPVSFKKDKVKVKKIAKKVDDGIGINANADLFGRREEKETVGVELVENAGI